MLACKILTFILSVLHAYLTLVVHRYSGAFFIQFIHKYVINSFGALYVGATGNVRYALPFVFWVLTVEEVCW